MDICKAWRAFCVIQFLLVVAQVLENAEYLNARKMAHCKKPWPAAFLVDAI